MLDLTELKEAEKKATPGLWVSKQYPDCDPLVKMSMGEIQDIVREDDAQFIALSRNLCRPMIEEIERLRDHNRELGISLDNLANIEKENNKLRTELAKARDFLELALVNWERYLIKERPLLSDFGPGRVDVVCFKDAREALRSIDESGLLA